MAGNSVPSDVLPVVAAGGWGVHVPFELTWALEHHDGTDLGPRTAVAPTLADLPAVVAALGSSDAPN